MAGRKLTDAQEAEIARAYSVGLRTPQLATMYGVTTPTISAALRRHGVKAFAAGWRGGRHPVSGGYVRVYLEPGDPMLAMCGSRPYVLEHRLVMARHLGRPLSPGETVHHINGVRDDNRIENLQLRTGSHGAGQALGCADCGSHRIEKIRIVSRPDWIDWTLVGEAA